jgi:hypothetical protein
MYFVKKLVAIRCTRSALSLSLSLSLQSNVLKANLASTVRGILKIAVKVWPLFDDFLTGGKHKCFGVVESFKSHGDGDSCTSLAFCNFPCLFLTTLAVPISTVLLFVICGNQLARVLCSLVPSAPAPVFW